MNNFVRVWACVALSLMVVSAWGQTPDFRWVRSGGTNGRSGCVAVAVDSAANVYAAGYFRRAANFQQTNLFSDAQGLDQNIFIAKFSQTGPVAWVRKMGHGALTFPSALATDDLDNCYMAGRFMGNISFDGITLINTAYYSAFLAKYGPTGDAQWAIKASDSEIIGIAVDHSSSAYLVGSSGPNGMIGDVVLTWNGVSMIELPFVVKCDRDGQIEWVTQAGESSSGYVYDIAVDASNRSYITGGFRDRISFGDVVLTNDGSQSIFLFSFDSQGTALWGTQAGRSVDESAPTVGHGVKVDASGNIYLTGFFGGTNALFGSTNLTSRGATDIFLAKYNETGELLWVKQAGGALLDLAAAIELDSSGNSYLTGYFHSQSATFHSTTITSKGGGDIFVAKYDASGNLVWVRSAGGSSFESAGAVALDKVGNCYIAGAVYSTNCLFGSTIVTASTSQYPTYFVAQVGNYPPPLSIAQVGNKAVVSWPAWASDFEIQGKTNLSPAENWTTLSSPIATIGDHQVTTNQLSNKTRFYRLRKN